MPFAVTAPYAPLPLIRRSWCSLAIQTLHAESAAHQIVWQWFPNGRFPNCRGQKQRQRQRCNLLAFAENVQHDVEVASSVQGEYIDSLHSLAGLKCRQIRWEGAKERERDVSARPIGGGSFWSKGNAVGLKCNWPSLATCLSLVRWAMSIWWNLEPRCQFTKHFALDWLLHSGFWIAITCVAYTLLCLTKHS